MFLSSLMAHSNILFLSKTVIHSRNMLQSIIMIRLQQMFLSESVAHSKRMLLSTTLIHSCTMILSGLMARFKKVLLSVPMTHSNHLFLSSHMVRSIRLLLSAIMARSKDMLLSTYDDSLDDYVSIFLNGSLLQSVSNIVCGSLCLWSIWYFNHMCMA